MHEVIAGRGINDKVQNFKFISEDFFIARLIRLELQDTMMHDAVLFPHRSRRSQIFAFFLKSEHRAI